MTAFAISFGVIFLAELGDKSQLMAMALATRYRALPVLAGITVATGVVHAGSVLLGVLAGRSLPTDWITVIAGAAFLLFAAWTLRGDSLSQDEQDGVSRARRSAFVTTVVVFLLAELGDKTMFATVTLATREGALGTWAGSTLGMVAADALAIGVGALLGRHLPARAVQLVAAAVFAISGVVLLAEGISQLT